MDPQITIAIVAVIVSSMSTLVQKLLVNQDRVEEIKEEMNKLKKESKEKPEDKEIQKEMFSLSKEMMKNNFKPMLITMLPILLVFLWLRRTFGEIGTVAHLPVLNIGLSWIWWYILISITVSLILEAIYKTHRKRKKKDKK